MTNLCRVVRHRKVLQTRDKAGERSDDADASEDAGQVLEELRPHSAINDILAVEERHRRGGGAERDRDHLTLSLLALCVERFAEFLPQVEQAWIALEDLLQVRSVSRFALAKLPKYPAEPDAQQHCRRQEPDHEPKSEQCQHAARDEQDYRCPCRRST